MRDRFSQWGWWRDMCAGVAALLLICIVASLQQVALTGKVVWMFVGFGVAGAFLHVALQIGLASKESCAAGLIKSFLVTGVLAACVGSAPVWEMPVCWADLGRLSLFGSSLFIVLYHLVNGYILASRGKSIGWIPACLLLAVPFVSGLLFLLQSTALLGRFGHPLAGRVVALFLVNEFVANAFALLLRRRCVRGLTIHAWLAAPALAVILGPLVADFGSGATVAALPALIRAAAAVICTMLSQAALWAEAFLLTGLMLDGMRGVMPDCNVVLGNSKSGAIKGAVFSGILMGLIQLLGLLVAWPLCHTFYARMPYLMLAVAGALAFPVFRTIIESFDGSQKFFDRAARAYRNPVLYGRGIVVGLAVAIAIGMGMPGRTTGTRILFGAGMGITAFAGISLLRDIVLGLRHRGRVKSVRLYLVEGVLGMFIGGALAFYIDANQLPIVLTKFNLYTSFGMDPNVLVSACNNVRTTRPDEFRALLSNWGYIRLSAVSGGTKMLFNEALIGVSVWGIAAWMFAVNRAFLRALFEKTWAPIRRIPSREGVVDLVEGTIRVMRWGLWMSPVIFTFLRPMGTPAWYNQDGAIRTVFATASSLFMDTEAFNAWSLTVFIWILVYSSFRILIFVDHMGLRVATLVNLSFIGMDRLDEKLARFIGPDAASRFVPEGVKRFTTWAPLLIPFYLPAGAEWDYVWNESRAMLAATQGGLVSGYMALGLPVKLVIVAGVVFVVGMITRMIRLRHARLAEADNSRLRIANMHYEVELKQSGEANSRLFHQDVAVTRPSYEGVEPAGRALFLTELAEGGEPRSWPILGNYPEELFAKAACAQDDGVLTLVHEAHDLRTTLTINLPDDEASLERWDLSVDNLAGVRRSLKVSPYLEWLLNSVAADRNHTQYNRLFPEMSYDCSLNAILALHRHTNKVGILAASRPPEGFLTGRLDFIGRAGTLWNPRALETLSFQEPANTEAYPTFDPIGAFLLDLQVAPGASSGVSFVVGCADSRDEAAAWIREHLEPEIDSALLDSRQEVRCPMIGHGEITPGTQLPYTNFEDSGATLHVLTPFTPRPFDHTMANSGGHVMSVTNRGLHCSTNGNAQQNRLTTDWADLVGRELPSEAIYLYDENEHSWFSPTYEPLRDGEAVYDARFGLDGSATFNMRKGVIETELTMHVPVHDPTGLYLLTIRNKGGESRRLRVAPYFQIALAHSPEMAGKLRTWQDDDRGTLFFDNPNNTFRSGPAFVAMTRKPEQVTTSRGAFFGRGRTFSHPVMVESGKPDAASQDAAACAGFLATVDVPAGGECTVAVLLGQADTVGAAEACIAKFATVEAAKESLRETRDWWRRLVCTLDVQTSDPQFNSYVDWMKYQSLAERIWARKGFYQSSGAFGFRDQLQDTVNLIWVDPALARKQLVLNAGQQFMEGDVAHWFFMTQDGRTGFLSRSHASDNLLWLGWGVSEYVRMTGDVTLLDEQVTYLDSETPLPHLPAGKHGMGFCPLRSSESESLYAHVLRAIDLVLDRRMGPNGLPLIGTGDWNDGLDEIGSEGRGESIWLSFFLTYILNNLLDVIESRSGTERRARYEKNLTVLAEAIEKTWRSDRYLRAIHDDGTEIGIEGAGYWETDALTAAWAVYAGVNCERARVAVDTAIRVLESDNTISLGYPPLRADTQPFLGRSSYYPEGVRENGMYSHGVQWLVRACRLLSEHFAGAGDADTAQYYRDATARLWYKIAAISHTTPEEIEVYGGQPNKQCADYLTKFDPGRMIWNGYTGAAAWMLRQACEGVIGATLTDNKVNLPDDLGIPRGDLVCRGLVRDLANSPID